MKFSAIIPAYNEGPRIASVLDILCRSHWIDEVIVIDDASSDNTKKVIEQCNYPKLRPVFLSTNGWKLNAVLTGVHMASGDYIVMIDADLIGLESNHIDMLIAPIFEKIADVTLSIRQNSLCIYKFLQTDFVSGERVIPKSIFDDEDFFLNGKGFSLEVKINQKIVEANYRVKNIFLPGLITPRKSDKMWKLKGFIADVKMIFEILWAMRIDKIMYQLWYFSGFKNKNNQK